jgi:lactobin A/cerein 7B family class IIb bacteriocin
LGQHQYNFQGGMSMRELSAAEVTEVSGGLGPLAVLGIDLALNGVLIAYAAFMTSDYMMRGDS